MWYERRIKAGRNSYMLQDQMGLIRLLFEELPEISRQAEAVGNLAFNVRPHLFRTNVFCPLAFSESDIQHQQPTQATGGPYHSFGTLDNRNGNSWHKLF